MLSVKQDSKLQGTCQVQVIQVQVHGLLMVQVRRASGLTFMPITSIRVGSETARPRLWGSWFIYKLPTLPAGSTKVVGQGLLFVRRCWCHVRTILSDNDM